MGIEVVAVVRLARVQALRGHSRFALVTVYNR